METGDAASPTGSGGGASKVVAETVIPADSSGGGLPLMAQMRNEYWVPAASPVPECVVQFIANSEIGVPETQSTGATAPGS